MNICNQRCVKCNIPQWSWGLCFIVVPFQNRVFLNSFLLPSELLNLPYSTFLKGILGFKSKLKMSKQARHTLLRSCIAVLSAQHMRTMRTPYDCKLGKASVCRHIGDRDTSRMHLDAVQNGNTSTIFPVPSSLSGCNVELAHVYLQSELNMRRKTERKRSRDIESVECLTGFDHNVYLRHKKVGALR